MDTKKGISSKSLDALAPSDGIVLEQEKIAAYRDNEVNYMSIQLFVPILAVL